ncbi:protein max isoform X1 [Petromyzon marinus]|uniref:Protein max n=1 Tax=Petromyzon marinus TaxID=7757 RepID=A0AAJ7XD81_PETMA|nr:protein max-like isoform X1 [Petromyzon marinus]
MSDNDDIEVESDADKRAHHNALERKRRDHIKDSFHSLRDSVPSLQGEKVCSHAGSLGGRRSGGVGSQASRAQILNKATEYIQYMRRKNHAHQQDIDDLKRQNNLLEQQVSQFPKKLPARGVKRRTSCQTMHGATQTRIGEKVRVLEKVKASQSTTFPASSATGDGARFTNSKGGTVSAFDGGSGSSSESEGEVPQAATA